MWGAFGGWGGGGDGVYGREVGGWGWGWGLGLVGAGELLGFEFLGLGVRRGGDMEGGEGGVGRDG